MSRLSRCPSLALCAALLLTTGCMPNRGHSDQAGVPAATATGPATSCEGAALTLAPGTVVGKMKGADIKVEDLGGELAQAEKGALRSYCKEISESRKAAFDNYVHKKLLEDAAQAEGKSIQEYLKAK